MLKEQKIIFISTYPEKKCGIASFTQDLVNSVQPALKNDYTINICVLDKPAHRHQYSHPVTMLMDGYQLSSCLETAYRLNNDPSVKLVCIEHEFGLYGGAFGEYVVEFLAVLKKPCIVRFHTVLPNPTPKMLQVVQSISAKVSKIIVMTKNSVRLLREDYHINMDKITIIPHGTHPSSKKDPLMLKIKHQLENKLVLTTFGLLSSNKGIEKGIMAMKKISKIFPEAVYVVLGQTHPNLLREEGEKYRNYLQSLISENSLQHNVRLINEYIPIKKLMEYLSLTDIYLFTSKDPNQAVSGTFLYAMSAGCAIISNSFVLAKEMLDEQTGVILSSSHEDELSDHAINILKSPHLKKQMSTNALLKTRNTTWEKVGQNHVRLFNEVLKATVFTRELKVQYAN